MTEAGNAESCAAEAGIIDIHTHFYEDDVAPLLLERYRDIQESFCEATRSATIAAEQSAGVSRFVLLPVAATPLCGSSNRFAKSAGTGPVIPFGTLHPADRTPERTVEILKLSGFFGIKLHPQLQGTDIDSPAYLRILRAAASFGMPVMFHTGDDPTTPAARHADPVQTARMLDAAEAIPGLTIIAAHLGGLDRFDDAEKYIVGRDIYLDTAMCAGRIPAEQYRRIIEKHGYRRILFGSDCPWQHPKTALEGLRATGIPENEFRAVTHDNAAALLGLERTPPGPGGKI